MKTPKEICQDIYGYICATELKTAISGKVSYTGRKTDNEDCCIEVQDNDTAQMQTTYVYVRVYVPNIRSGGQSVENAKRTGELERLCADVLERHYSKEGFRFELRQQLTTKVNGRDEYVIANKLEYKHCNE